MQLSNNQQAFLELVRAGLWEKEARLLQYGEIDFNDVMRFAEMQSVVGLVTAGLEHVKDIKVPQEELLIFIGTALQMEHVNRSMNSFIGMMIEKMQEAGIYALLIKGQGIAQCYERPLWRASGDVDLLLYDENYSKAMAYLLPKASSHEKESNYSKHIGLTIDEWTVELHGTFRCGISSRMDKGIDNVQEYIFHQGNVRTWKNGQTLIYLPSADSDAIFIFTHFLKHFFKGGIGLKQICDWCRLLWSYRESLNHKLLESRIRKMGLITEWKAFAAFAVDILGMPKDTMPLYDASLIWKKKAEMICSFIIRGSNSDEEQDLSYYSKYPYLIRKVITLWRRGGKLYNQAQIFTIDSVKFFCYMVFDGLRSVSRGE